MYDYHKIANSWYDSYRKMYIVQLVGPVPTMWIQVSESAVQEHGGSIWAAACECGVVTKVGGYV